MGVHGLWQLLQAAGRPVSLETLDGKVLAVDVSLWLHQTMKGMRDKDGNVVPNAHLHGLFTRICKLLFYRIKPVFVFDGGVPTLKKQTLAARRERREHAERESGKANKKLLENLIKSHAVKAALGEDTSNVYLQGPSTSRKPDMFELTPLPDVDKGETDAMNYDDDTDEDGLAFIRLIEEKFQSIDKIDTESAEFKSLPPEIQHEILTEMKEVRKKYFVVTEDLPEDSDEFSSFQLSKLMKRSKLSSQIEDLRKVMNARSSGEITESLGLQLSNTNIISSRVVSEDSSHYILIKGLSKKQQIQDAQDCEQILSEIEKMEPKEKVRKICTEENSNGEISSELDELLLNSAEEDQRERYKKKLEEITEKKCDNNSESDSDEVTLLDNKAYFNTELDSDIEILSDSKIKTEEDSSLSDDEGFIEVTLDPQNATEDDMFPAAMFDSAEVKKDFIEELMKLKNKKLNKRDLQSDSQKQSEKCAQFKLEAIQTTSASTLDSKNSPPPLNSKNKPSISNSKNKPSILKSENKPSITDDENKTSITDDENKTSVTDDVNKTFITDDENKTSITDDVDKTSITDDVNKTSITDDVNKTSITDDVNKTSITDDENKTSISDDENKSSNLDYTNAHKPLHLQSKTKTSALDILKQIQKQKEQIQKKYLDDLSEIDVESQNFHCLPPEIQDELHTVRNQQPSHSQPDNIESSSIQPSSERDLESFDTEQKVENGFEGKAIVVNDQDSKDVVETNVENAINLNSDTSSEHDVDEEEYERTLMKEYNEESKEDEERIPERNFSNEFLGLDRVSLETLQDELQSEGDILRYEIGKQDRLATSITDQMNIEAQELLRLFGIPYIVSPMEAEAQCAFLDHSKLTHGSITDDSDIWLFGGERVYKNFFNQKRHVELYTKAMIDTAFGLSRHELVNVALLCGSDYTEGIQGVGPVTALEIMAEFAGDKLDGLKRFRTWWEATQKQIRKIPENKLRNKLRSLQVIPGFPSEAVVEAYFKPTIDDSLEPFSWGTPDLDLLREFGKKKLGWTKEKVDELIKPLLKQLAETRTQTKISGFFQPENFINPARIKSQRIRQVLGKINSKSETNKDDDTIQPVEAVKKPRKPRETKTKVTKDKADTTGTKSSVAQIKPKEKGKRKPGQKTKRKIPAKVRKIKDEVDLSESSSSDEDPVKSKSLKIEAEDKVSATVSDNSIVLKPAYEPKNVKQEMNDSNELISDIAKNGFKKIRKGFKGPKPDIKIQKAIKPRSQTFIYERTSDNTSSVTTKESVNDLMLNDIDWDDEDF